MGISPSCLDETTSNYIKGRTDAALRHFSPHFKHQYQAAYFTHLQNEVEQHQEGPTQLLKQKQCPAATEVLHGQNVLQFDDDKKWKVRFVLVQTDYSLEIHDSHETFTKGVPPRQKLFPTGGTVFTSEEKYLATVDRFYLSYTGVEDAPSQTLPMPGQFPVYLWLPYRKDFLFCFNQEEDQTSFLFILTDCIRHQNHDFIKNPTYEVEAFLKAVQFYREEKNYFESWNMLIGNDVCILANVIMEELLPCLTKDIPVILKGKKTESKKSWFSVVEAAHMLVQEHVQKELTALKVECQEMVLHQEALIRADMDQIISSRAFLAGKLGESVTEPAMEYCTENIQPYLASILEEIMTPITLGFNELRQICVREITQLCGICGNPEALKQGLEQLRNAELHSCYKQVEVLPEQLAELRNRFQFSSSSILVQSIQIDMQQLMQNVAYTFEMLLSTALKNNPATPGSAFEKTKKRVLKQYDYDSSTVRKRIFHQALLDITLPALKESLASTCKLELSTFDEYIFADYASFIQVENVYEDLLLQILEKEINRVVKEAAHVRKNSLYLGSIELNFISQSSLSNGRTPPPSPANTTRSPSQLQGEAVPQAGESCARGKAVENDEVVEMVENYESSLYEECRKSLLDNIYHTLEKSHHSTKGEDVEFSLSPRSDNLAELEGCDELHGPKWVDSFITGTTTAKDRPKPQEEDIDDSRATYGSGTRCGFNSGSMDTVNVSPVLTHLSETVFQTVTPIKEASSYDFTSSHPDPKNGQSYPIVISVTENKLFQCVETCPVTVSDVESSKQAPLDSIKAIRDLVLEVIEVEEEMNREFSEPTEVSESNCVVLDAPCILDQQQKMGTDQ